MLSTLTTSVTRVFRLVKKMHSLKTWNNFDWSDFIALNKMAKTFKVRHLALSNYQAWKDYEKFVYVPEEWNSSVEPTPRKKKKKKPSKPPIITVFNSSSENEDDQVLASDREKDEDDTVLASDDKSDQEKDEVSASDKKNNHKEKEHLDLPSDKNNNEKDLDKIFSDSSEDPSHSSDSSHVPDPSSSSSESVEVPVTRKRKQKGVRQQSRRGKRAKLTARKSSA